MKKADEYWMAKALALAERGEGLTRPNPPVGAAVVLNGELVGQGWHRRAGGPHAEAMALKAAGQAAAGATLYVTLEPCSAHGLTPPCVDAILESGIARVVAALRDPNPVNRGKGFSNLRRRGIEVVVGVRALEARKLIAPFAMLVELGRPYVTLKLGVSLDGKIADATGKSRWITGSAARRMVQDLRRRADAILVGAGTVVADDPSLLPRPDKGRKPFRVILDASGAVGPDSRVLSDEARARTIMVTTSSCQPAARRAWLDSGAEVWVLPGRGRLSIAELLRRLGKKGLLSVLCEGGAEVVAAFIKAGLVDEYVFFVAPRVIGGAAAKSAVGGNGWKLAKAPTLSFSEIGFVGEDILIRARPSGPP